MGLEEDLPPGDQLLTLFRPFLEHLAASNLSPKTIQKHVDNMWVLGGEFIRDLHSDTSLRNKPVERILRQMIFGAREKLPRAALQKLPGRSDLGW
jgi:hypothetical protein